MKTIKRVLAIMGVVLLLSIYIITFVSAVIDSPHARILFEVSVVCTIAVPVFLYGVILVYRLVKSRSENTKAPDNNQNNDKKVE